MDARARRRCARLRRHRGRCRWPTRNVELAGIEPACIKLRPGTLRPFPSPRLAVAATPGRVTLRYYRRGFPRRQRSLPAVSRPLPTVHRRFCCRAAVIWPRVPSLVAGCSRRGPRRDQAARARESLLASLGVPRLESLSNSGRVLRRPVSMSKPNQPLGAAHCSRSDIGSPFARACVVQPRRGVAYSKSFPRLMPNSVKTPATASLP